VEILLISGQDRVDKEGRVKRATKTRRTRAKRHGLVEQFNPNDALSVKLDMAEYGSSDRAACAVLSECRTLAEIDRKSEALTGKRNSLGEERIARAQNAWFAMYLREHRRQKHLGTDELLTMAREHPEVDDEVFAVLDGEWRSWHAAQAVAATIGNHIYEAVNAKDSSLFNELGTVVDLMRRGEIADFRRLLLLLFARPRPADTPRFTLSELTRKLNAVLPQNAQTSKPVVHRWCKQLGIPLKPGKPGPHARHGGAS
jgi:hypothetical protein